jgi:hypothetical protein
MSDDLIEEKFKIQDKIINDHEERIKNLEKIYVIMAKMETTMNNIKTDVTNIKTQLNEDSEKKGMKWDKLIDYLFYAILAYCLYKLGIKK